jgi:hypothetical protein
MLSSLSSTIITVFDIADVPASGGRRATRFVREAGDGSRIGIFGQLLATIPKVAEE